jgi:hypothetical protein
MYISELFGGLALTTVHDVSHIHHSPEQLGHQALFDQSATPP